MAKVKVTVDRDQCIGCGVAPTVCPQVFVLGSDNGKNRVVDKFSTNLTESISEGELPEDLYECAAQAASSCPVSAIRVQKL
ncbi:MAG: ferredoxin [Desulfurococcales archaeon]|jgi:ferredoxin|nr:ferredoxin [Thermoprotei archaeon]NAY90046.1 ferredoxin [Desulfurococcales archaeon]